MQNFAKMSNRYIPHTEEDIAAMLERVGVKSLDDLYADVPSEVIFRGEYALPEGMSEVELRKFFGELGRKNRVLTVFAGGGAYDHYAPSVIPHLLERSEFYGLHSLSAGDLAGHPAIYLRISEHDKRADRASLHQRLHV